MGFFSDIWDSVTDINVVGDLFGGGGSGGGSSAPNKLNLQKLAQFGPLLISLLDRNQFQQDPVRRALLQGQIDSQNFMNMFEGGRFNIGNPIGDALSGFGGAFGVDQEGNPLTAAQGLLQRTVGEASSPTNISTQAIDALSALGNASGPRFSSGITGGALDVGQRPGFSTQPATVDTTGVNPDFQSQGIPQGFRPIPQAIPDLPQTGGVERDILFQLADRLGINTDSLMAPPSEMMGRFTGNFSDFVQGLGDRLSQSSLAGAQPQPNTPNPGVITPPVQSPAGAQPQASFQVGVTSVPNDGNFQLHAGEQIVPAGMNPLAGTAPQPISPPNPDENAVNFGQPQQRIETQFAPPAPFVTNKPQGPAGFNSIFRPVRNQIDAETAALLRNNRNSAGAFGTLNTGEFRGGQADIQRGRVNQLTDARFQAGQQFFGQNLEENQFAAGRFDANRGFDFAVQNRQDDLNLRAQTRQDELFNLLLSLSFSADQLGSSGIDPALSQQPAQTPIPLQLG